MWENYLDEPFVLSPKRAAVFREAAVDLSDSVGWEDWQNECSETGVAVFDNLSQGQKQLAILVVAKALLDPNVEPPTVTAAIAATVDAIYCQLEGIIGGEPHEDGEARVRKLLLEAMEEANYWNEVNDGRDLDEEPITPLSPESDDMDSWSQLVECLRTEILEDYDFEMEGHIADMDPVQAEELRKNMNINPDYFVEVVEDPRPERLTQIRSEIRQLLY